MKKTNLEKIKDKNLRNTKGNKGITLIALVITIIVLLILASISINLIFGNKGIVGRSKFAEFINEYSAVNEAKEMYVFEREIDKVSAEKTIRKLYQVADVNGTATVEDSIYPVSTKLNVTELSDSLKYCIVKQENIEESDLSNTELVNLRYVDFSKISVNAKRNYVINVVNGNLYSIEGEEYDERRYQTITVGVNPNAKITLPGNYELVIDAGEGKIVNWEVLRVFYDRYVQNTLSFKVYTSNDRSDWKEHSIQSQGVQDNKEEIEIINPDITRYLKIEVQVQSINGNNSEISNIMVNYFGYRTSTVTPEVTTTGTAKVGKMYTVPTPSNGGVAAQGTGTVTQTLTVPTEAGNYVLNSEMIGNPSTTIKVTKPDGTTSQYTVNNVSDLTAITLEAGSQVEITSTLSAGDGIGEVELLVEDRTELSQKESTAKSYVGDTWKTENERTYMYDNGGSGFWERCSLGGINIDKTGIINQGDNKRVKVTYQTSSDGENWSEEFTNIQDAENIRYLKVRVQYQVFGNVEYGSTSSNVLAVILNDGSYKARFLDEDGTLMFTERVYFTSQNETAEYTMPNTKIQKTDKVFAGWISGGSVKKAGETITLRSDIEFRAKYRVKLDILTQGKASFSISPNTRWQSKVTVSINNTLEDEETTILQYKIGDQGTWVTYDDEFEVNKNTKIYGRFYNTFTQEIGYEFEDEITVIDGVDPEDATITLSATSANVEETITATVTHQDSGIGIDITKCKYIINQSSEPIGKDSNEWNSATAFTTNPEEISITETGETKNIYLHVLSVDENNNKKETISDRIRFKGSSELLSLVMYNNDTSNFTSVSGWTSYSGQFRCGGNSTAYFISKDMVDVTNLSKLTFSWNWSSSAGNAGYNEVKFGLSDNNTDLTVDYSDNTYMYWGGDSGGTLTVDTSELEGEFYVKGMLIRHGSSDGWLVAPLIVKAWE